METITVALVCFSIILLIICVGLLFILLKKNNNKDYESNLQKSEEIKKDIAKLSADVTGVIRDEFRKSRVETTAQQSAQRQEIGGAMADMNMKLNKMVHDSYEYNSKMSEMISS